MDAANEADQGFITPACWDALPGCLIDEFVALSLFVHTAALRNGGVFKTSWLSQPKLEAIYEHLSREVIEQVSRIHFVMTRNRLRAVAKEHAQTDWRPKRYEFNLLLVRPFIELPGKAPIAPVLYPILARATPGSLYYTLEALTADQKVVVRAARNVIEAADAGGDQASADLAARRIDVHEKNAWMLSSHLE